MTQPQQQRYTPGEIIDFSRTKCRSRVWPAPVTTWTATVGGVAATGTYSFDIDGITISYGATVPTDDNNIIAANLDANFDSNLEAIRIANSTVASNVLTIAERFPGAGFTLSNDTAPGGASITLADVTDTGGELLLGLAVALVTDDTDAIRTLTTGDTAASVFGVTAEGSNLKPNDGLAASQDAYEEGDRAALVYRGAIPVRVETPIAVTDSVFVRVTAAGTELAGAFRNDADGGDAVQLANCRWLQASYNDRQGRLVALLELNLP